MKQKKLIDTIIVGFSHGDGLSRFELTSILNSFEQEIRKDQDKITRHACAESIKGLISRDPCDNCSANYACEHCNIKAILNTKAI